MRMPLWARMTGKMGGDLLAAPFKAAKAMYGGARAISHQLTGFSGLGIGAFLPGAAKLAVPALLLGGAGLGMAARNLLGEPYSMENAPVGYTPGAYSPYNEGPMSFSSYKGSLMDSGADGSLLMALHNQRKA